MSSLGGQWRWRALRHYLSASSLHAELEKLVPRDRWPDLIKNLEKVLSSRLSQDAKETSVADTEGAIVSEEKGIKPHEGEMKEPKQEIEKRVGMSAGSGGTAASSGTGTNDPAGGVPVGGVPGGGGIASELRELSLAAVLRGLWLRTELRRGHLPPPTAAPALTAPPPVAAPAFTRPTLTRSSLQARTVFVVEALGAAESRGSRCKRAADLVDHLLRHPETKDLAIKAGAVRVLLRLQDSLRRHDDEEERPLCDLVCEALSLVGWTGGPRGRGAAVLALDGGGVRGLVAIELLRRLEQLAGRPAHQLFDYVIGVSTGAILAAVICSGAGTLETASKMYVKLSKEMFGNTSLIGGTSRLVWSQSYYDTAAWEKMLRDQFGERTLTQCSREGYPKMAVVSCVSNAVSLSPFVFRSYAPGRRVAGGRAGAARAQLWQAVRASAAAPTYFTELCLDGLLHQDGGIVVNNPCGVGVAEARLLFGARELRRGVVVSLGTGRPPSRAPPPGAAPPPATGWRDKFNKILDSATDTEGVHLLLNELLPAGQYFRFNPPLLAPCSMDEIDDGKIQSLLTDTREYIRRNDAKLRSAARMLVRRRSLSQRAADYVRRRAVTLGLADT